MDKNLNLDDIARLAGVSRATVSRVINNYPHVSEAKRQRVLEVIERYNFQPNAAARALASQSSRVIGIIVPELVVDVFADPFFPLLLQSITRTANEHDYDVTLWLTSETEGSDILRRALRERLSEGLIIAEASANPFFLDILRQRNKPFVLVGRPDDQDANYVDAENRHGAQLMTRHLIAQGRRRIGIIPGRANLTSAQDRLDGYLQIMQEAGLPAIIGPDGNFTEEGGYKAMMYLLQQEVDAVFGANDLSAMGAMRAIKEAGYRIPDDIVVGGFDDIPVASTTEPPLTTVRQPIDRLGAVAVQALVGVLRDQPGSSVREVLPVELIVRESS